MLRYLAAVLVCAAAQAATLNVNLTVQATIAISSSSYAISGQATLTGGITDSGTFSATVPVSSLGSGNLNVPYTLTLANGTMGGNVTLPVAVLLGGTNGSGTITVTTAGGSYAGDSGT